MCGFTDDCGYTGHLLQKVRQVYFGINSQAGFTPLIDQRRGFFCFTFLLFDFCNVVLVTVIY